MRKLYTNAIFLLVAAMIAAAAFAAVGGANPAFAQASLIFGTTLAGGALSVGMVFASRKSQASFQIAPWLTPIDLNVAAAVLVALFDPRLARLLAPGRGLRRRGRRRHRRRRRRQHRRYPHGLRQERRGTRRRGRHCVIRVAYFVGEPAHYAILTTQYDLPHESLGSRDR